MILNTSSEIKDWKTFCPFWILSDSQCQLKAFVPSIHRGHRDGKPGICSSIVYGVCGGALQNYDNQKHIQMKKSKTAWASPKKEQRLERLFPPPTILHNLKWYYKLQDNRKVYLDWKAYGEKKAMPPTVHTIRHSKIPIGIYLLISHIFPVFYMAETYDGVSLVHPDASSAFLLFTVLYPNASARTVWVWRRPNVKENKWMPGLVGCYRRKNLLQFCSLYHQASH